MERLKEAYMQEADDSISQLVSLIEPTLVTILSIVIGGILLSVMLPLLSILSAIG
jgi:type IV pilus assembly protein PilC